MSEIDAPQPPKRGRGRPPKSEVPRTPLRVRLPENDVDTLRDDAAELGLPLSDYIAMAIYKVGGYPVPDYIQRQIERNAARTQERIAS